MPTLISSSSNVYSTPTTVKLGNMTYNNILHIDSRDFIDNDNKRKVVNYLSSNDGNYVSYLEDGIVTRSEKRYFYPQTKKLGGRVYNNILSNILLADGTKLYEDMASPMSRNIIKINPKGEVFDSNLICRQKMRANLVKPFKMLGNVLRMFF